MDVYCPSGWVDRRNSFTLRSHRQNARWSMSFWVIFVPLEGVRRGSIAVLADGRLALTLALAIGALLFLGGLR